MQRVVVEVPPRLYVTAFHFQDRVAVPGVCCRIVCVGNNTPHSHSHLGPGGYNHHLVQHQTLYLLCKRDEPTRFVHDREFTCPLAPSNATLSGCCTSFFLDLQWPCRWELGRYSLRCAVRDNKGSVCKRLDHGTAEGTRETGANPGKQDATRFAVRSRCPCSCDNVPGVVA